MCAHRGVLPPANVRFYLFRDKTTPPSTESLRHVLKDMHHFQQRVEWLFQQAAEWPNAVIFIDAFDWIFPIDKNKSQNIIRLYTTLYEGLLSKLPEVTFLAVFNLKKADKRAASQPNLLENPRGWLQETAGSLAIQDRSDVRLGLDETMEESGILVLNGLTRGRKMEPIILEHDWRFDPEAGKEVETGFVPSTHAPEIESLTTLSERMQSAYNIVGDEFSRDDLEAAGLPRATAYRMLERMKNARMAHRLPDGRWKKGAGI